MLTDARISSRQLTFLLIGFVFGSTSIMNPVKNALQDAWLAYLVGWFGGFLLITLYVLIAQLNPNKTLIQILREHFGKLVGNIVAFLYIWYFIHLAALVLRNFGEFFVTTSYHQTPLGFVMGAIMLLAAYAARVGIEVIARASELVVIILIFFVILLSVLLLGNYQIDYFYPILEHGWKPIFQSGFSLITFPFGETVVFLMLFPYLNQKQELLKASITAIAIVGSLIFLTVIRELMVLGPTMLSRVYFPAQLSATMIPGLIIEPLISVNLLIGGGIKITLCCYGALIALTEFFHLKDYKPFTLPVSLIITTLSVWLYENLLEMMDWAQNVYPYYAIPFQILIPILLLFISWYKRQKRKKASNP